MANTAKEKKSYQFNLYNASNLALYNIGERWQYNTLKYRALLSNDPSIIKYTYQYELGKYKLKGDISLNDTQVIVDDKRSFYAEVDAPENAEEYFGIIPMICEALAKLVTIVGYTIHYPDFGNITETDGLTDKERQALTD